MSKFEIAPIMFLCFLSLLVLFAQEGLHKERTHSIESNTPTVDFRVSD